MSTREKVIVGLMMLAVIYGVYTVFFSAPQEETASLNGSGKDLETLNLFISKIADKTNDGLSEAQVYALQKAQAGWKQDPMMTIEPKLTQEEITARKPLVLKSQILYTGFLQMGDKRLAILNGIEHEIGDRLEPDGLIVRNIFPNHVVVGSPDIKSKKLILPMEEIE
ncbi:hypothetical protein D1AOALGA4SA_71 [Olavius algarvensis Delta 1 endosymbiont]|nr:hypothetical protein D1AOALGA4SA_71 [Olavius algarvensis Delta 1 endosymbiont]